MTPAFPFVFVLAAAAQTIAPISASASKDSTPAAKQAIRTAIGAVLQADGSRARELLSRIPTGELNAKDAQFRTCAVSRLVGGKREEPNKKSPTRANAFAQRSLAAYQTYWRQAVINPAGRVEAERKLIARLSTLLGRSRIADMDAAEPLLAARLTKDGLYSLQGQTGKLRELMVWSRQTERVESVPLPEGANATRVVYLDGFLSQGWGSFFTCVRTGTGGWTKPDGLYVVVPGYKTLTDENFRVNFLAHESQHYSDNRRFPNLPSWRLEYRAKLVELIYALETHGRVLQGVIDNQGDDPADAHSFADKKLVLALTARLGVAGEADLLKVPVATFQKAVLTELLADSLRLKSGQ